MADPFASQSLLGRVMMAESGGNPRALSKTGAMGLMQLMPGTARNPGFGVQGTNNPWDPTENKRVGTDYLNAMLKRYGGDEEAALIAYNAGAGNADKWMASGRNYGVLPKRSETEPYVNRILGGQMPIGGGQAAPMQPQGGPMPVNMPVMPNKRNSKLAEALLASAAGAKPKNWGDLLNAAGDLGLGYALGDKADKADQGYKSQLAQMLSGATNEDLPRTLIASGDDDLVKQGVAMKVAQAKPQGAQIGRFKVDSDGNVLDSATGQIVVQGKGKANKAPAGYRESETGDLTFIPGGPADPANKPKGRDKYTEVQTKAANFGNMMVAANKQFEELSPNDAATTENPKNFMGAIRDAIVPGETLRNSMTPSDTQAYNQVAAQWIRAKLRKESGAAIGTDEMAQEFKTYFPQYGDGPEVIKQKAASREEATKGMLAESSGAYDQLFPGAATPSAGNDAPAPVAPPVAQQAAPKGPSAPTPAAVDFLRKQPTPEIMAQFNAKYGPGAAEALLSASQAQQPMPQGGGIDPSTGAPLGY